VDHSERCTEEGSAGLNDQDQAVRDEQEEVLVEEKDRDEQTRQCVPPLT